MKNFTKLIKKLGNHKKGKMVSNGTELAFLCPTSNLVAYMPTTLDTGLYYTKSYINGDVECFSDTRYDSIKEFNDKSFEEIDFLPSMELVDYTSTDAFREALQCVFYCEGTYTATNGHILYTTHPTNPSAEKPNYDEGILINRDVLIAVASIVGKVNVPKIKFSFSKKMNAVLVVVDDIKIVFVNSEVVYPKFMQVIPLYPELIAEIKVNGNLKTMLKDTKVGGISFIELGDSKVSTYREDYPDGFTPTELDIDVKGNVHTKLSLNLKMLEIVLSNKKGSYKLLGNKENRNGAIIIKNENDTRVIMPLRRVNI